jgi:hypothetical protein
MATATRKPTIKKPVAKKAAVKRNGHAALSRLTDLQVLEFIGEQRKKLPDVTHTGIYKAIRSAGHSISLIRVRNLFYLKPVKATKKATPRKAAANR